MRPSFRPSSIHIMLIVLPQIASKRGLKIGIILFVYIHIKLRAPLLPSACQNYKMREQCQLICSNRSLKIRICIVVIIWIKHSGVRVHQIIGDRRCFCCRGAAVSCRTLSVGPPLHTGIHRSYANVQDARYNGNDNFPAHSYSYCHDDLH